MYSELPFWQQLYQRSQLQISAPMPNADMQLNHLLNQFASVDIAQSIWLPSPAKGVARLLLERDGGEKTLRATSIVSYAADSLFSPHSHPLGEEFFVLNGTFSDEHGDYPAGTYVRNPPLSSHQPFSKHGCMIWVKLQQFNPLDRQRVVVDVNRSTATQSEKTTFELFNDYEKVTFVSTQNQPSYVDAIKSNGAEVLVLKGKVQIDKQQYAQGMWFRQSKNTPLDIAPNSQILLKQGHLEGKV